DRRHRARRRAAAGGRGGRWHGRGRGGEARAGLELTALQIPSRLRQPRAFRNRKSRLTNARLRREFGNQSGSAAGWGKRGERMESSRENLRIPLAPWRWPIPDAFQPPIGTSIVRYLVRTSSTLTAPVSIRLATSSPRRKSRVKTDPPRP